ncbi:MAG: hypothetical protein HYU03_06385 [Thaumarchaeota archaeon]|nr:hypothetical protein [Nitrososphaerota archaeon]
MLKIRGVKVHDDTHRVLKQLKTERRSKSMDVVIRDMVRASTGKSVEQLLASPGNVKLTSYVQND